MMKKRGIPTKLKERQQSKRLETIKKIQEAIDDIKQDGSVVTKKRLMELTGLSNSTFSKDHVIEVLRINKVCQFKNSKRIDVNSASNEIEQLQKVIEKLEKEKILLKSRLQDKEIVIEKLKKDYQELSQNYSLILGKIHLIMKKVDIHGVDIGIDFDNL
ncbi:DUF6262 family protein [Brevibacillus formosus]